jgi:predicted HicB family RNase H-like nuclease
MEGTIGTASDDFRPKIYGLLGMNFFRINDLENAKKYTELALSDCERTGDRKGMVIYTENLKILVSRDSDSVAQCRRQVAKAQDLSDHLQYEYSNKILLETLINIEQNPDLRYYRSKVYGLIGSNNFRLGDMQHAKHYTELAINDCETDGDVKGIRIYKENLRVILEKIGGCTTK